MKLLILVFIALISNQSIAVKIKLKVHPEPDDPKSKLIWFNTTSFHYWSEKLDNFLEVYRYPLFHGTNKHLIDCDYDHPTTEKHVCKINTEKFTPCINTKYFGYKEHKPCIFIEIEKLEGWRPKYYNDTKLLPKAMPQSLKNLLQQSAEETHKWENIWVSCDGDTAADQELIGPVRYYPKQGYPGYLFPYVGQEHYFNPIVAVQFPKIQHGLVINVICKLWGPGIDHAEKKSLGAVSFEILVDNYQSSINNVLT